MQFEIRQVFDIVLSPICPLPLTPSPNLGEGEQKGVSEGDEVPLALSHSPLPQGEGGIQGGWGKFSKDIFYQQIITFVL